MTTFVFVMLMLVTVIIKSTIKILSTETSCISWEILIATEYEL